MTALNSLSLRSFPATTETPKWWARAHPTVLASLVIAVALAGCDGDAPKPAKLADAPQEAVSRVGDITIRANVLPTASLGEAMAKQYGIAREDDRVMLLVSVRQGPDGQDTAVPARIEAKVSNLQGQHRGVEMRELRTGDYVDYVGTAQVTPPDTLRFELEVVREGGARSTMTFSREFAAR
ncbi:MAG: DUF4426 domain-containing protein [Lysobacter sp.]|nr:MAG: DUF4426 domain-containing protein [Lysobacter sp.]